MPKGKKIEPLDLHELENNPVYDGMYDHLKTLPTGSTPTGSAPIGTIPSSPKTVHLIKASTAESSEKDFESNLGEQSSDDSQFTPIGPEPIGAAPLVHTPIAETPAGTSEKPKVDLEDIFAELAVGPRPSRSRGKVIPATRVEHGHSATQDALYWYLWRVGKSVKGSRSHFVQAGYGQIQAGIGVDRSNVQDAIRELQKKLSIRVVKANTVGSATIYEVFCCDDILAKRREARLLWARTYGKRRVDLISEAEVESEGNYLTPTGLMPTGVQPLFFEPADVVAGVGEKPTDAIGLTPTGGIGFTPIHEVKEAKTSKESTTDANKLRDFLEQQHLGLIDDDVPRRLLTACRARAGDSPVTVDQVISVVRAKLAAVRNGRNPIGLLIEAVPKYFPLPSRPQEMQSPEELPNEREYWQRVVDDPNAPEALRKQAKRLRKV
jgi:hypothetical protein